MKKLLIACCGLLLYASCTKERAIVPSLAFDNVYAIKDNPNDPIQHRVYQIYKQYAVPVYFNDTIGRVYIMDDVQGNPIFQYEKVDLAWTFNAYAKDTYVFNYMQDAQQKSKALDVIEAYLQDVSKSLRPFSFFVTQSGQRFDKGALVQEYKNGFVNIGFRTVYVTGNMTDKQIQEFPSSLKRQMILNKIGNYVEDVAEFGAVSKSTWYGGVDWSTLDLTLKKGWSEANALYDNWAGAKWYTEAELIAMRTNARNVIGKFGFVKGNHLSQGLQTPRDANYDLQDYVVEMLKYSPKEFEALWGGSPLVMKKYQILRNVIENKMDVKL